MTNQKESKVEQIKSIKFKVTKTSYDKIIRSINDSWPEWKKNLCNEELIVSVNSKKI